MDDGGGDQDQKLSRAHRLSADLPAILRYTKEVQQILSYVQYSVYCVRIYDMFGTTHPGNTVPKGGGCLSYTMCVPTAEEFDWEG